MKDIIINWSGGKDSALALYHTLKNEAHRIKSLTTTINAELKRITMHGVHVDLLDEQAKQLQLPLHKTLLPTDVDMPTYDAIMQEELSSWKAKGIEYSLFGDIFLEDLKSYREIELQKAGIQGIFPLWKRNTTEVLREFLDLGFKTIVVCVNSEKLPKEFSGRIIDENFIKDLPKDVDPCGENGEFHTFVYDGPIFKKPISFKVGKTLLKTYQLKEVDEDNCFSEKNSRQNQGFWYTDLQLSL